MTDKILVYGSITPVTPPPFMADELIAIMKARVRGYYWIFLRGEWIIAEWFAGTYEFNGVTHTIYEWIFIGSDQDETEESIRGYDKTFKVDERRLTHD